jgi:hypothetical protein
MPWRQVWEPSPKDENLPVLTELPIGVYEDHKLWPSSIGLREADGEVDGKYATYTYCHHCNGWVKGTAVTETVNTLDASHLAGRQGTEYYCRRCGTELAFMGKMS